MIMNIFIRTLYITSVLLLLYIVADVDYILIGPQYFGTVAIVMIHW